MLNIATFKKKGFNIQVVAQESCLLASVGEETNNKEKRLKILKMSKFLTRVLINISE